MAKEWKFTLGFLLAVSAMLLLSQAAEAAISTPSAGTFAYDIYDITVNKILKGPIGFVAGVSALVIGAISLVQAKLMTAVPAVLGGAALLKADDLVASLGVLV